MYFYFFQTSLKFSAPHKVGVYTYSVILKSDCYIDFDQSQNIKVSLPKFCTMDPFENVVGEIFFIRIEVLIGNLKTTHTSMTTICGV